MDAMCSERWGCAALPESARGLERVTEEEEGEVEEEVVAEVEVVEGEVVVVEASELVVEEEEEEVLNCAKKL